MSKPLPGRMTRQQPDRILIATTNPGKVRELQASLGILARWSTLLDFPGLPKVEEDGKTFAENAAKKACGYAKATGLWTISDDSGLEIDALGGLPGVRSARFAGVDGPDRRAIDLANIDKVLGLLKDVPWQQRTARFVCHVCLASPDGILAEASGTLEGLICLEPVGENGFGYDPIFFVPALGRTVAQLDQDQKNAISHRGKAIKALLPRLRALLSDPTPDMPAAGNCGS
ncbi:MAG: RdgB/HAM1 family non-canonical purine NTP pyrophosphatase [Sedimentisphaerales bacterium]|nr:RdgB/HAM1 family non-canonical purine NTP pyrophosphatase [Sedimentisphaerales bacterium]